jgi:hypothetical protein
MLARERSAAQSWVFATERAKRNQTVWVVGPAVIVATAIRAGPSVQAEATAPDLAKTSNKEKFRRI